MVNINRRKVVRLTMNEDVQAGIKKLVSISDVQVKSLLKKVGELYVKHLETSSKSRLTPMEESLQNYAAREVAASIKEEVIIVSKGDEKTAKKLLKETMLGYREISRITGCTLNLVSEMAKTHRSAEVREMNNPFLKTEEKKDDFSLEGWDGTIVKLKDAKDVEAATLLKESRMSYGQISKQANVEYGRVGYLGPKFRSPELRRELQAEHQRSHLQYKNTETKPEMVKRMGPSGSGDRDKAVEMIAKGGYTFKDIWRATGVPMGSLTKLKREYEAGEYKWENPANKTVQIAEPQPIDTPIIDEPAFIGDRDLEERMKRVMEQDQQMLNNVDIEQPSTLYKEKLEKREERAEHKLKTIPEAIEEFTQEMKKEYREELRREVMEEMQNQPTFTTAVQPGVEIVDLPRTTTAEFDAIPKSPRKVRRKISFEAGGETTALEASEEIEEILSILRGLDKNAPVVFEIKVNA